MKSLKIPAILHRLLKIEASRRGISISVLVVEIFTSYLKNLTVLLLLVMTGCASTYTKVDAPNEMRYRHDQKMVNGMEMREVMDKFGSPQQVKSTYNKQWAIVFIYRNAIFCQSNTCFVYFDRNNKEVYQHINFRQEFTSFVNY